MIKHLNLLLKYFDTQYLCIHANGRILNEYIQQLLDYVTEKNIRFY